MKIKLSTFTIFRLVNGLLCLTFILVFIPVKEGDSSAYIELAKQIFSLDGSNLSDLSHRSPLYSILVGILMIIFGQENFILPLMILQYFLVFGVSVFVYHIFYILTENTSIAFISGLISTINLSTVFYAYNILSETLALFLFVVTIYCILLYYSKQRSLLLLLSGLSSGLLVLTRFNLIGLPLVILGLFLVTHFSKNGIRDLKKLLIQLTIYSVSTIFVINLWALYNYQKNGFYNIFQVQNTLQRWAIPSTINESNIVSQQNQEILKIFLSAKKNLENEKVTGEFKKGSLLNNEVTRKIYSFFKPQTNGYMLYRIAEPELLKYFSLDISVENINILSKRLKPFYKEIAVQNKQELIKLRVFSFLYTFKYVSPILRFEMTKNLNTLPVFIIKFYKYLFLLVILLVFIISFIDFLIIIFIRGIASSYKWIILYGFIWYFPFINFYANVLNDANRFKFPAESIILGLAVVYIYKSFLYCERSLQIESIQKRKY